MEVLQVYRYMVQEALLPDWIICKSSFQAGDHKTSTYAL